MTPFTGIRTDFKETVLPICTTFNWCKTPVFNCTLQNMIKIWWRHYAKLWRAGKILKSRYIIQNSIVLKYADFVHATVFVLLCVIIAPEE